MLAALSLQCGASANNAVASMAIPIDNLEHLCFSMA